jgi:nitrate/nitrite transport system ATP-binding protein
MIEICGLWKSYRVPSGILPVLCGLDWQVDRGQWAAIVGRSGSGKSTLVGVLAGLIAPDAGRVRIGGREGRNGNRPAVVFQGESLFPWLSAYQNVLLALHQALPRAPREVLKGEGERLLRLVGLSEAAWKRPRDLSGGMRQRVSLARALALPSPLLLLDEPFSALDAFTRYRLQEEVARIASSEGRTVVLVTNDLEEALRLADRVWVLVGGKLLPPEGIRLDGSRPRLKEDLWSSPELIRARHELSKLLHGPAGVMDDPREEPGTFMPDQAEVLLPGG